MKSSLKKLRGLAQHRAGLAAGEFEGRRGGLSLAQVDEVSKASQDIETIRACYDNLLSASAAAANSAYEFSESLREMGDCLLENTAFHDDEESGSVLLMLGKLQYELQHIVDKYRAYIFQTITVPSESLLNELHTVEEMKRQCDEKRESYEYMVMRYKDKLKNKNTKGDSFTIDQIQAAHDEYDDDATLFVFRLKSLKKGQPRSLLTQAARHHAAQLWFFKKALKSLEDIDPHVRKVAEKQHIDYNVRGQAEENVDEGNENDGDEEADFKGTDEEEFNKDLQSTRGEEAPTSRTLMDLDLSSIPLSRIQESFAAKGNPILKSRKSFSYKGEARNITQSAPLFNETRTEESRKLRQRPSFNRKSVSYALPTPNTKPENLEPITKTPPLLKETNSTITLPKPDLSVSVSSDFKKLKRYSFSGPISPAPPTSENSHLFSAPLLQTPKVLPCVSSPRISELHELPRPPARSSRAGTLIGHSAPLAPKEHSLRSSLLPTPSEVFKPPK